ncbi:hypothetical protein ACPF8X_36580 [Streptomyces sp. G35A]
MSEQQIIKNYLAEHNFDEYSLDVDELGEEMYSAIAQHIQEKMYV